jgi:hypothetical protein
MRLPHELQQATEIVDLIGYTPLIRLRRVTRDLPRQHRDLR